MNMSLINTAITDNDRRLIELWLHGRSPETQRAYRHDIEMLLDSVQKPLQTITLYDLQAFSDGLAHLEDTSKSRVLSAVKSLLTFAYKSGYTPMNVGAALRMPKVRSRLAERILSEEQVQRMLALETNKRNHALLRLLYTAGLRVSEVCDLTWRDVQARGTTGQVTVYGKGGKERAVLLSPETYSEIMELRGDADDPVFLSRKHGHLDPVQVRRIVTDAARRAGINGNVSPHWLRHAHASHSLDRGAPINLVRDTLGHASLATTGKYTHARPNASSSQFLPL